MRILLAADATEGAKGAARLALALARDKGAEVRVVRVLEEVTRYHPTAGYGAPIPEPDPVERSRAAARERTSAWLAGFGPEAKDWPVEVAVGNVPREIARLGKSAEATLLLIGLGRHDRWARWLGGETALRVAQLAEVPVLAAPPATDGLPRVALAAVDFSAFSQTAVAAAMDLLAPGAVLHLAHVVWEPASYVPTVADTVSTSHAEISERLDAWSAELRGAAEVAINTHVLEGEVAGELLGLGARLGVELLVAGSHGTGFFARLMLGSVSTRLLRGATSAVLVAPRR